MAGGDSAHPLLVVEAKIKNYAGVAQLVEQCFRKAEVEGSTPSSGYFIF
tara:strand:+ start:3631 stop:3777 length:147 start_codon:yes stop_codon:yes gene_type:complete